jgi:DHA2 family multidrug resistance protein
MTTATLEPAAPLVVAKTVHSPAMQSYPLTQGVNPWLVTLSVMLPTFMEVLDTSIASVALPYIAGSLSASNSEATWS